MFILYVLTFANGKYYVGQTSRTLRVRMQAHTRRAATGSHLPVHCAWRVLGEPSVQTQEFDSQEALHAAETFVIRALNCRLPNGYNVTHGADTAPSKTPSVAAKISAKAVGRRVSAATRELLAAGARKNWLDPEYRLKVIEASSAGWTAEARRAAGERLTARNTGTKLSVETRAKIAGYERTPETRSKMSESAKVRKRESFSAATCEKISSVTAKSWADPVIREKRSTAIRAAWAKKRALKADAD